MLSSKNDLSICLWKMTLEHSGVYFQVTRLIVAIFLLNNYSFFKL